MTEKKKEFIIFLGLFVSLFLITQYHGSTSVNAQDASKGVYLKTNIHVQEHKNSTECRASYANWTSPGEGHLVIPVNTLVSMGDFQRGFAIIIQSTKKPIRFELDRKAAGMGADEYWRLITSAEPVPIDSLSPTDQKGVKDGKAYVGMTKDGVRIALGYPARHKTPSLENNVWYYWTNRFKSIAVEFDETGKVKSVGGKLESPK